MTRLIATDLDGTLLRSDGTIGRRTREAFAAAHAAGIESMAVSGRQAYAIAGIVADTALVGDAIGSNGGVGMRLDTREVLFEERLDVGAQQELATAMRQRFPGIKARAVRHAGDLHLLEHGFPRDEAKERRFMGWPVEVRWVSFDEVLAEAGGKLVLQHETVSAEELLRAAREFAVRGCHATISGAPFLEVGPEGVTKATGLERYCAARGIDRAEVIAFGDNVNDVELLRWAGVGVAMGNASAEARDAADRVTGTNDEDGIARVIETLL